MFHCRTSWSGHSTSMRTKKTNKTYTHTRTRAHTHTHKRDRANFRHSFAMLCLLNSQCGWGAAEHTKGRGQTSLTTTTTQGGCITIYNLPCLLHDSRGGWREGERVGERERERRGGTRHTVRGWPVNSRAEEKTIVFLFP